MENDVIVNIDLTTIENIIADVLDGISLTQLKLFELHQFLVICLGLFIGLAIGYIFLKVGFDGD